MALNPEQARIVEDWVAMLGLEMALRATARYIMKGLGEKTAIGNTHAALTYQQLHDETVRLYFASQPQEGETQ